MIVIVLLVLIGGVYFFSTQSSADSNLTINETNNTTQINPAQTSNVKTIKTTNNANNTNQNSTPNVKISPKQAQINAVGAEKESSGHQIPNIHGFIT